MTDNEPHTGELNPAAPPCGLWALSPLPVFLCLYLLTSVIVGDFYKIPITAAFFLSAVYAVAITRGLTLDRRLRQFSAGAANRNVKLMIWIFILAGAFAQTAKDIGAIDATVNLTLHLLPGHLLPAGIFIAACFVSLSIGTSVGTIVALIPVAAGIAEKTELGLPFLAGIVVGGAFFGDNLSFISDTTIASTKTQGCAMGDKFRANAGIVFPAAILVLVYYIFRGMSFSLDYGTGSVEWIKVIPYIIVLVTAIAGVNVCFCLVLGIAATCLVGLTTATADVFDWFGSMGTGIMGMGELIIVTLLAAGMLEMVRFNGGIDFVLRILTARIRSKRGAEASIAALVSVANLCTANNTIAIITVGPLARNIAERYGVDKRKSAGLLDTFSCVVQGVIPYGAQLLMAAGLAVLSPVEIIAFLYYPLAVAAVALLCIALRFPRKYS